MSLDFGPLILVALVVLSAAWFLWRLQTHRTENQPPIPAVTQPDWYHLLQPLIHQLKSGPSRVDIIYFLAELLRTELGVTQLQVWQVGEIHGEHVTLQAPPQDPLLGAPALRVVALQSSALGHALVKAGVAGSSELGFAMAWPDIAVEFASIGLPLTDTVTLQVLEILHGLVEQAPQ